MKVLVVLALAVAATSVPSAQADTCLARWGSGAKTVTSSTFGALSAVRVGHHACFDRLVLDDTRASGYRVGYVAAVHDQGRGAVIALRGGARLQVDVQDAASSRPAMPDVSAYPTLRQIAWGGSFEGSSTLGVGVRARLPFRVFRTAGHLVIDVAHHW